MDATVASILANPDEVLRPSSAFEQAVQVSLTLKGPIF